MRNITLSIPKDQFNKIRAGEQSEAYLTIKPYWMVRLTECYSPGFICCVKCRCSSRSRLPKECRVIYKKFKTITFVNGTKADRQSFDVDLLNITVGKDVENCTGKSEKECFILKLGQII